MRQIITGQVLLIVCCIFYLCWWYLGYKPGIDANRIGGVNGILLMATAIFGVAGIMFSLMPVFAGGLARFNQIYVVFGGIAAYISLLFVTRYAFSRIVTTELMLIVIWTMIEVSVLNNLSGSEILTGTRLISMYVVIALAFAISMVLYVAYYRMEEMRAFYAAMVPLITEGASMAVLVVMLISQKKTV